MNRFESLGNNALEITINDKLSEQDYEIFKPLAESHIDDNGSVNLLLHVKDTPKFTPAAFWEDLKFDVKHYNDVGRLAIVSEENSKGWLARISKPFTSATVEAFPEDDIDGARAWVKGEVDKPH